MQRRKASVSLEVKQVIGTLCRLLTATGLDTVPAPDTFRRAKFGGGPEVEGQFWQLLANIFQRTGSISFQDNEQESGESEHKKVVAAGLRQCGYHTVLMDGREKGEGDGEKSFSSTDLLLALGWLLATGMLEKQLTLQVQQLDKTLFTPLPLDVPLSCELQLDSSTLRKLQWLVGHLRHQRRILLSMSEERTRLLHAVFCASLSSGLPYCSNESSAALREDCGRVRQLCSLLEAYLNWKEVEHVFWTWMDSVVDCHQTVSVIKGSVNAATMCQHNTRGRDTYEDFLSSRPTTQAYRVRLQGDSPLRDHSYPTEKLQKSVASLGKLSASQASLQLRQAEASLLDRRDRRRLNNRMQLQEVIGELEGLVLISP